MSKKVFTIIHDLQYLHFPENFSLIKRLWLFFCHNISLLFSTKVIAISDFVLNDIKEKYFFIPFKRIFRLYNSVDFSDVDPNLLGNEEKIEKQPVATLTNSIESSDSDLTVSDVSELTEDSSNSSPKGKASRFFKKSS